MPASARHGAVLWIGYLYGAGALVIYLAAYAQGVLARRVPAPESTPAATSEPNARAEPSREPAPERRGDAVSPDNPDADDH
jgi:hypothetical protein